MKKRILVICMFTAVLCCQIDAQYISVHAYDTLLPSAGHTIVRSWGSDRAVSYFVTTGYQPRMVVVDQTTGITRWVNLPDEVYIKDMCVDEQTISFISAARQIIMPMTQEPTKVMELSVILI